MLESFLAGAKATIRRAGALDREPPPDTAHSASREDAVAAADTSARRRDYQHQQGDGRRNANRVCDSHKNKDKQKNDNMNTNSSSINSEALRVRGSAVEREEQAEDKEHVCDEEVFSLLSSVSRSFSRMKAAGASSAVNKALFPLKRALGEEEEERSARSALIKYRAQLSSALSDATSTAAKRHEERCLLVAALKGQESDLGCWGYRSVLPSFREHRRQETTRADLRTQLAEQHGRILSVRLEETTRLLKTMPIFGAWTQPGSTTGLQCSKQEQPERRDSAGSSEPSRTMQQENQSYDGTKRGGDAGLLFEEESFIVAPAELLANHPDLSTTQRQLRLCDHACAAAADAFARKVVDAGGLEPRSHEERSQILLALLSRYHVLVRSIGDEVTMPSRRAGRQAATLLTKDGATLSSAGDGGTTVPSPGHSGETFPSTKVDSRSSPKDEQNLTVGKKLTFRQETLSTSGSSSSCKSGQPPKSSMMMMMMTMNDATLRPGEGSTSPQTDGEVPSLAHAATTPPALGVAGDADTAAGALVVSGTKVALPPSGRGSRTDGGDQEGLNHADSLDAGLSQADLVENGYSSPRGVNPACKTKEDIVVGFPNAELGRDKGMKRAGQGASVTRGVGGVLRGEVDEIEVWKEGRKACEEAFLELLSDERTREGRLLRRFLTMALAKQSPALLSSSTSSTAVGRSSASGARGSDKGDGVSSIDTAWEGDGAVEPKVVKAFINYFSNEYLKGMFDVPDVLVPVLSQLVGSMVFRQARQLVLGYDRQRVTKNDAIWREKAKAMRSLSLVELGAPPEYVPVCIDAKTPANNLETLSMKWSNRDWIENDGERDSNARDSGNFDAEKGVTLAEARAMVGCGGGGGSTTSCVNGGINNVSSSAEHHPAPQASLSEEPNSIEVLRCVVIAARDADAVDDVTRSKQVDDNGRHQAATPGGGNAIDVVARSEDQEKIAQEVDPTATPRRDSRGGAGRTIPDAFSDVRGGSEDETVRDVARMGIRTEGGDALLLQTKGRKKGSTGGGDTGEGWTAVAPAAKELQDTKTKHDALLSAQRVAGRSSPLEEASKSSVLAGKTDEHAACDSRDGIGVTDGKSEHTAKSTQMPTSAGPAVVCSSNRAIAIVKESPRNDENAGIAAVDTSNEEHETTGAPVLRDTAAAGVSGRESAQGVAESAAKATSRERRLTLDIQVSAVRAYAAASRELERLGECFTPEDMEVVVKQGITLLAEEAKDISASEKPLDADALIPLLVYTLVNANLPRVHESLNFIRNFRGPSWGGEYAYYVTCIEAAVSFVLDWSVDDCTTAHGAKSAGRVPAFCDKIGSSVGKEPSRQSEDEGEVVDMVQRDQEGREALMRLGIFLENHQLQEDTVDVLSSLGWL